MQSRQYELGHRRDPVGKRYRPGGKLVYNF